MKNLTKMCLILSCVFLVSCNQAGEGTSPAAVPEHPTSDLSGTVTSVINFLNPISSAHAADDKMCKSDKKSNGKVKIYLVDPKGNEILVCHTSLNTDGTFKKKIKKSSIPSGSVIKISAMNNEGALRESFVNLSDLTALTVDGASTLAVPVIKYQRQQGKIFDAKIIRNQIGKYIEKKVGTQISTMKANRIAALQFALGNSQETLETTLFNPGKNSKLDSSFQMFLVNVFKSKKRIGVNNRITEGNELVYSEENAKKLDSKINGKIIEIVGKVKKK